MRFSEFKGEWEETTLENISGYVKDKVMTSSLSPNNYISTENLMQDFQGVVAASSIPLNASVTSYKTNDVLFSNIRPYLKKSWKAYMNGGCSTDVFVFRHNESCLPDFLYYTIANDDFVNYVMTGAKGVKMPRGDKQQIAQYPVYIPTKSEQGKITSYLTLIDERISTQNKIIEKLESLIKGIYRFLLGASRTSMSLAQICDIKKGQQINKSELSEFGKYYVMNGGVTPSGFYDYYNANANTISISEGGNSCGYVQYNNVPFWSGGHCYTLENIEDIIDIKYLFHYLKANESQLMTLRIGSGLPNIQKKDLAHFRIPVTEIASQVEISGALDKLTTKVEVEKNIALAYHTQKQYLLSNMFI